MLYEFLCIIIAAFGAYGVHCLLVRFLRCGDQEAMLPIARGVRVAPGFSLEELEDALFLLREESGTGEAPVLLIDYPLRDEVLRELRDLGAALYLSYEEYYCEKGK